MTTPDRDMNRRVAELLGWELGQEPTPESRGSLIKITWSAWFGVKGFVCYAKDYRPTTDANQADAAVREWCGDDLWRQAVWGCCLMGVTMVTNGTWDEHFVIGTATPEQKITALLAAADALKDGGA